MGIFEVFFGKEYKYHDTPEGEDCLQKLLFVTKYCAAYGIVASSADVMMFSHPQGYPQIFARYAYITLPFMGMGAAFVSTSCIAANIRKKDDPWNYWLGGAASGMIAGAWRKSIKVGSYSALCLGAVGALIKDLELRGLPILGEDAPIMTGDFRAIRRDFSMTADPGKL